MSKLSYWTIFAVAGQLASDLNECYSDDKKIDFDEILKIGMRLIESTGLALSSEAGIYIDVVTGLVSWLKDAAKDRKITAIEVLELFEVIALKLGYDFDKMGININGDHE